MYQNLLFAQPDSSGSIVTITVNRPSVRSVLKRRIGLVNHVVPSSELRSTSEALAKKIMVHAPQAVRFCMQAVHLGLDSSLEEGQVQEAMLFGKCCMTEDMQEGTKAFLEKRAPDFKGK
jgi:enoyl-CoA hydratase